MKKQWRNLSVLVVIVVVAVLVYALIQPFLHGSQVLPLSPFEQEFSGMSNTWVSYGLDSAGLHAQSEALLDLSDAQLGEMKGEISDFGSTAKLDSTKALANAYVKLIDSAIASQNASDIAHMLVGESICDRTADFENLNSALEAQIDKAESYTTAINAFVSAYPDEALEISAYAIADGSIDSLRSSLSQQTALFEEAKGVC